jgi:hypothetical protein
MVARISLILLISVGLGCAFTSSWAQAWKNKSFTEWSLNDTTKILNDSPWAQTQIEHSRINYGLPITSYAATMRLRSALPIRQALLRQKQIVMNYQKFTAADKERFDRETKDFVECSDCAEYYLVTVGSPLIEYPQTGPIEDRYVSFDIIGTLKSFTVEDLKLNVYLANDKGERRELVRFIPPKGEGKEAMFVFPRHDSQGRALITRDNKEFHFRIEDKLFKGQPMPLKPFTFQVAQIIQDGQIVF